LLELHLAYERAEPFPLKRKDVRDCKVQATGQTPRVILKTDRATGTITLDTETTLSGVPPQAWDYHLATRSALDWVLDQHKERKPKDPVIRSTFNTYRFSEHKERVIDLIARVVTVSVQTRKIVEAMAKAPRV
jgi:predicted helicase